MSKSCAFSGHRLSELGSYNPEDLKPLLWELHRVIVDHIEDKGVVTWINGVALGWDMWSAMIIIKLKEKYPHIKLVSAIPCRNHSNKWPQKSQDEWQYVVDNSDEVVLVTDEEYKPYLMQVRNVWMTDRADYIIAGYNGRGQGGTYNCLEYAAKRIPKENITIINPNDFK